MTMNFWLRFGLGIIGALYCWWIYDKEKFSLGWLISIWILAWVSEAIAEAFILAG